MLFQKRPSLKPVIFILFALALTAVIWFSVSRNRPQVIDVFPTADGFAIPAQAPLHITFDRPMNLSSVESALSSTPQRDGTFTWEEDTLTFTPNIPWPRGAIITITLATTTRTSAGIQMANDFSWSFHTAPTLLAYLWPASKNDPVPADLYILDPVSGDVARLTETDYGILDFSHNPDGLSILLSLSNKLGGADVAVFDLLTRSITILHECGNHLCTTPQFDPQSRWITFEDITSNQIFIKQIDSGPVLVSNGRFPSWSTSGLLFYDSASESYIMFNPETGGQTNFPNITGEPAQWAEDGSFFLAPTFTEIGQDAFASHILQHFINTSEPINLTLERLADDNAPTISPNGSLIAFARRSLAPESWTPGRQLWIMNEDGRNAVQLTETAVYHHTALTWHPDNAHIAFLRSNQADLNEAPEIWMINIDGTPPIRLVINGFAPAWLP